MKAGLPKKYAKMGFKKGWKAFKKVKSKYQNIRKSSRAATPKIRQVRRTMARRKSRKTYRKSSGFNPKTLILPAAVYGAARERVSDALAPFTSKIPLGDITDEVVLGTACYYGAKKLKGNMRNACIAGLIIESARIGEAAADGSIMGSGSTSVSGVKVI